MSPLLSIAKSYPPVLWALFFYLLSLGFDLRFDVPLALFVAVAVYSLASLPPGISKKEWLVQHWPVLVFLLAALLVTVCSSNIKHSMAVQAQLLPATLVYIVMALFIDDRKKFDFVLLAMVLSALLFAATFLVRLFFNELVDPMEKVLSLRSSFITVPNDVLFLSVIAPLALAFVLTQPGLLLRVSCLLYLVLAFILAVYLQSRQAVGVFIFCVCMMAFLYRPRVGVWVGVACVVVALLFDWLLGKGLVNKLVLFFPRQYVWGAAWEMFLENPLTGLGPGMFKDHYFEFLEKAGYLSVEDHRPMKWAHSLYFEQLAERGVVGSLALGILVLTMLFRLGRGVAGAEPWMVRGLLAMLAGFLLAGVAEASLLRLWTVHLLFFLAGATTYIANMGVRAPDKP